VIALLFVGAFSFVLALLIIASCIDWINRVFTRRSTRGEEPLNSFQRQVYGDRTPENPPQTKHRAPRSKKSATTRKKL